MLMGTVIYFRYNLRLLFSLCLCLLLFSTSKGQAQSNSTNSAIYIPEPLMFDLVRGLGAQRGELEVNTLADFPLNESSERGVEWAPEIEYALFDGFAVELEFPMRDWDLEAYKMAVQWTIGTSSSNKFIHGIQIIAETLRQESLTEFSFLYVPAYRFNDTWSTLGLFGVMVETGADAADKKSTILLNASLFADLNDTTILGLEFNNSDPTLQVRDDNEMTLLILPQVHYELPKGWSIQGGFGPNFIGGETDFSGVLRMIKTF